ncbi:MAG: hypothetical protein WBI63_03380, partial [Coriobacteriia bacterium]
MKHSKSIALIVVGLVAGIILGSVGIASAATAESTPTSSVAACGLQMGAAIKGAGARLVDVLAGLTGQSVADIQAKRADGQSISDIAEAEGVDTATVVEKALAARKAILDERVAAGTLTQAQADAAYAQMADRLSERVNSTATGRPSWAGQGGACGGAGAGACGGQGGGMRGGAGAG